MLWWLHQELKLPFLTCTQAIIGKQSFIPYLLIFVLLWDSVGLVARGLPLLDFDLLRVLFGAKERVVP